MLNHLFGLIFNPRQQWQTIGNLPDEGLKKNLPYALVLAIFPAVAWYFGTTQAGWQIGNGEDSFVRVAEDTALSLAGAFYVAMVIAVAAIGYFIHWMAHTYGAKSSPIKGIVIAGFTATPIFVAGIAGIYPIFWFDLILGTAAIAYAVYLLYLGIPIVMDIPQERGFLFASAIVAVALVMVTVVMGVTVIFWEFVSEPEFVR
ncbi:MAG: YIP1 family protein [Cellvibrionaceae bacterium]